MNRHRETSLETSSNSGKQKYSDGFYSDGNSEDKEKYLESGCVLQVNSSAC